MSVAMTRRRQAIILSLCASLLLAGGLALTFWQGATSGLETPPDSLTPRLSGQTGTVAEIGIETAEEGFLLQRTLEGWALESHDSYRADPQLAERLIGAVAALEPIGERTARPDRYADLDLADPAEGGGATRLTMRDNNGRELADLLIGRQRPDGHLYMRRSGDARSWLVRGFLPGFADSTDWMELDFLALGRSSIRETCVLPLSGPGYCLQRPSLSTERFEIVSPEGYRLVSPGAGDGVATTLARVRFRDIRPAAGIGGERVAEHRAATVNGLEVTVSVFEQEGEFWAELVAVAHSDAAREAAIAINERADGWAFQLSELTTDRLIRPLAGLAVETGEIGSVE